MKNWLNKYFMFFVASLALMSCEKDEDRAILKDGTAPLLSASTGTLVLTEDNAEAEAITFNWDRSDFGYQAAVNYTLQMDVADDDFASAHNINLGSTDSKKFTVAELNTILSKLGYEPEVAHDIDVRIRASIADNVAPVYSNELTINVTPYSTYIEPGYLYVPGDYQGWKPELSNPLISVEDNGIYTGIISFTDPSKSLEFKFTPEPNWDMDYGAGAEPGTLVEKGGNLTVPAHDSYMFEVNTNTMTWSAKKHSWGLIGDATPGGWGADTNMTYDAGAKVWRLTVNLVPGNIKFRFNDDWGKNYGDNDRANNLLDEGGSDIPIAEAGLYEITFDNENEDGTVTYSVTKL